LVNDLVDPICVISNANEILSKRLGRFLDAETRSYFEMIARAATKTKTLVEELRNDSLVQ
jgi:light-regulated signal transduction histidine kinase (bacteriophytochrome)